MIWTFVDYENIGSLKDIDFKIYQRVFIFYGPKNSNINIGTMAITEFLKIEIFKINTNGANNLDFHIAYYLGKFPETADEAVHFHVISNDNGFNGLVNHIKESERHCKRVSLVNNVQLPNISLSPCSELAIERLKQINGRTRPRKEP